MLFSILAIGAGAALGAVLRWALGLWLNGLFPALPPGTLAANLLGGYLIGAAVAFFAAMPGLSPAWKLLIVTGFCGGLTTFSTFSAETVALLSRGEYLMAAAEVGLHVAGSLAATAAGIATVAALRRLNGL
ncbi:fluoride efflux transporter CrcB [Mesosutterella sp. OilRF-GAM-744-9]|uniref:Fluoride-specific ion channel FluC n=1 Tax=Mesosutterella porci TaxID=2915351 RepID=A0ABS9MTR2_9BURK|nr:fluoride efflux transporter CrcB [Mesosutterella sp. oilRF-744-WT-GAM-9]MCG5031388.1 fluoride efflux transporter CrcB [Mesosutterella sp. oilRF-744-WT-GAM-9]MCI6529907.1 fluoride efflux transporter CrcB [Mesosutterella sp.]